METTQKVTLKGLRKIAKSNFRARRSSILLNYGGIIFFAGGFLAWIYIHSTASVAFALPVAIGMIALIFNIAREAKFVDSCIQKWCENAGQLPKELK